MRNWTFTRPRRSFTMVELLVVVAVIVLLVGIIVVASSAIIDRNKAARTTQAMDVICTAVEAFKQSQGYYPLSVPDDVWAAATNWNTATTGFAETMGWYNSTSSESRWQEYFVTDGSHKPAYTWASHPSNIHMLVFQLQQVPESKSIIQEVIDKATIEFHKSLDASSGVDQWDVQQNPCQIRHPLDAVGSRRTVYQPQDGWGIPLRYWSGDVMKWAKGTGGWGNDVQRHLSEKLKAANWGVFIESAGPDGQFGWYGNSTSVLSATNEDNIYSIK